MGLVHHAVFPVWFEMARTELLRASGQSYAAIEQAGIAIVVARLNISYRKPAHYDNELAITATLRRVSAAKIEHDYQVHRDSELLCTGSTVLACVNRQGRVVPADRVLNGDLSSAR